jgi:hypothetical protein
MKLKIVVGIIITISSIALASPKTEATSVFSTTDSIATVTKKSKITATKQIVATTGKIKRGTVAQGNWSRIENLFQYK